MVITRRPLFSFYAWGQYAHTYIFRRTSGGVSRVPYYTPTNPRSLKQQTWRAKLREAMRGWFSLGDEEKNEWRKRSPKYGWTGYNYFLSEYLKKSYGGFIIY